MQENLRAGLVAGVTQNLMSVGVLRHKAEEILFLGQKSLNALSAMLGDKPYLFGARPTGTDAFAFATIAGTVTPFFSSPLRQAMERNVKLVAYARRMMEQFYPDFAWAARAAA